MQREILFKAKRKDNGEWVYGYIIKALKTDTYFIATDEDTTKNYLESKPLPEVIPETICQYTGLKDKNGKKIFENDILQGFEEYYDEFVKGMVDLDLYNGIQLVIKENSCHFDYIYDYEVIGNVFDEEVK